MKILKSIIKEQVENKIDPILKEKYQANPLAGFLIK